jgi:alkylation response protein AidB-like acyl-CoA dehydrogenase
MRPGGIRTGRTKISLEGYPMPSARTGTARKLGAGGAVSVNGRGAPPDEDQGGVPLLRNAAETAAAARGSVAVAQAKVFATEVAGEVTGALFDLSGASATDEQCGLSRHWRNSRPHASHDPASWKYHHLGNFMLNDVLLPNHGQL